MSLLQECCKALYFFLLGPLLPNSFLSEHKTSRGSINQKLLRSDLIVFHRKRFVEQKMALFDKVSIAVVVVAMTARAVGKTSLMHLLWGCTFYYRIQGLLENLRGVVLEGQSKDDEVGLMSIRWALKAIGEL